MSAESKSNDTNVSQLKSNDTKISQLKSNDTNVSQLKENEKKQVPLRLSATLWRELAAWAEDDFRSINGQIEYLLTECVRYRKKTDKNKDLFSKE